MSEESMFEAAYSKAVESGWDSVKDLARQMWDEARTQLASTGGEAVEVVAYRVSLPSEPELGHWFDEQAEEDPQMCMHEPLMTVAQHNRIVAAMQPEPDGVVDEILELILAECRYWHGRDEARRGNFAILYAAAKELAEKKAPAGVVVDRELLSLALGRGHKSEFARSELRALLNQAGGDKP